MADLPDDLPDESNTLMVTVTALSRPVEAAACVPDDMARALARGICRMLDEAGQTCLYEFTLRNGRRADVIALAPDGSFTIVEIKTSVADFRADGKWPEYLDFCDRFYFAVPEGFPRDLIPQSCGLIVADAFGGAVVRESSVRPLAPARRKALTLAFARLGAMREVRG